MNINKKLKICIVIPRMGGGGAERVTAHIANKLVEKGMSVILVTFVSNESFYKLDKRVKFVSAMCEINRRNALLRKISMLVHLIKAKKYLNKVVYEEKPDVVLSMLSPADIITYFVKIGCKKWSFKWISSERAEPLERNKIFQLFLKRIYTKTDAFVCQSKKIYHYYESVPLKAIIPNPLSTNDLPDVKPEEHPLRIVAAGRLTKQKNFSMLIEAFAHSKNQLEQDTTLTIYGDGPLRDALNNTIANYGLNDDIILFGSTQNLIDKINGASLFVLSSDFEGFPNVLLEAMSMGLPVISTDFPTGVAKELIKDENGIIVPVNDSNAMSKAIIRIMNDSVLRDMMRKKNVYVRDKYDANKIVDQWLKLVQEITK